MNSQPIVEVTRGDHTESVHLGAIAAVEPSGRLLGSWGDPDRPTFMRSCAKPFQAIHFLESGAADAFEFTTKELALVCASHTGHQRHVELLAQMLKRTALDQNLLKCGIHRPLDTMVAWQMVRDGQFPSVLHNNCAGKHIGMLTTAEHLGFSLDDYLEADHPLQIQILADLSSISGVSETNIAVGTDGCSAPNFAIPIKSIALAFARLAEAANVGPITGESLDRLFMAMTSHPELVSGPGKLDAVLMQQGHGQLLAKEGAEGVLGIGLRGDHGETLGVAIKIWDGDPSGRALAAAAFEALDQLGWLSKAQRQAVEKAQPPLITTRRDEPVGRVRATFQLEFTNA